MFDKNSKLAKAFSAAASDIRNNFAHKAIETTGATIIGTGVLVGLTGVSLTVAAVAPVALAATVGSVTYRFGFPAVKAAYQAYKNG